MQHSSAARLAAAGVVVLMLANAGCAPAVPEAQVRDEIGAAMFAELRGRFERDGTNVPGMVIWAEPGHDDPSAGGPAIVDIEQPIKVWLYAERAWSEPADMRRAIEEYYDTHVRGGTSMGRWAIFTFAITSLQAGGTEAEVMLNWTCGGLCGVGTLHTLKRNAAGQWEIVEETMVWIS